MSGLEANMSSSSKSYMIATVDAPCCVLSTHLRYSFLTCGTIGPVVRFMPDDLHFNDPDYYDEIYTTSGKTGKPFKWANAFGPYPAVSTSELTIWHLTAS